MTAGPLTKRSAVVTGAGRGIGAAIARSLARAGASVVVTSRTAADVEGVAQTLAQEGVRAFATACDVTDEVQVKALGVFAREKLGAVDILVNNAGHASAAPLHRITLDEWNRTLAVNATGAFLCAREFAPAMVARAMGRIVNVASIAGLEGAKYVAHYCAAKHAVVGFTRALAVELTDSGVTANAVCPAYVDSPMTDRTLENVQTRTGLGRAEALAAVLATTQQERLVTADEVARAVLDLCLESAAGVNGEAVVIRPTGDRA